MKKSSGLRTKLKLFFTIGLMLITLTACPPQFPLKIKDVSVHPKPKIGQTVTLHVEIISTRDEKDVTVWVSLPEGVKLMSDQMELKGALTANQHHFVFLPLPTCLHVYVSTCLRVTNAAG